jgi:hypothetical protein
LGFAWIWIAIASLALLGVLVAAGFYVFSRLGRIPDADWIDVTSQEGRFNVKMPGSPTKQEQQRPALTGPLTIHMLVVERKSEDCAFMVSYFDVPELAMRDPQAMLIDGRDGEIQNSKGTLRKSEEISLDGHPGLAFEFDLGDGKKGIGISRIYIVKQRAYALLVIGSKITPGSPEVPKFLNSFRVFKEAEKRNGPGPGNPRGPFPGPGGPPGNRPEPPKRPNAGMTG